MHETDKCRLLARAILGWFEAGIFLDDHAEHYIDTCLPGLTLEELGSRLCEPPDLEIAPLMDLIFFPGERLQVQLEPLLEAQRYTPEDEERVADILTSETPCTTLRATGSRHSATLPVPPQILVPFVRRLGISRRIPARIADTIVRLHPAGAADRVKVRIRNSRVTLSEPAADFLNSFLLGMHPGDGEYHACLELLLALLREQKPDLDPFDLLRMKTDAMYRAADAARDFERQLRASNMETLMLLGMRAPETGLPEAERKITLLARIGEAVALGGVMARRQG